MPTVTNRTRQPLCLRTGQTIPEGGSVEVSDVDAETLAGHPLVDIRGQENRPPQSRTKPDVPDHDATVKEDDK